MKTLKDPRGRELLSDRALAGLSAEEREELTRLLSAEGLADDESFDVAAAALDLATAPAGTGSMPAALAARLESDGRRFLAEAPKVGRSPAASRPQASTTAAGSQVVVMPLGEATAPRRDWTRWAGWLAAAAAVAVVVGQQRKEGAGATATATGPTIAAGTPAPSSLTPPVRTLPGVPANDPRAGRASATLAWSDGTGHGELRVGGLPAGSYEVWIEDAARGERYRLAAGAFVAREGVEAVVPVGAAIPALEPSRLLVTAPTRGQEMTPLLVVALR
jgi:hypothetical protein